MMTPISEPAFMSAIQDAASPVPRNSAVSPSDAGDLFREMFGHSLVFVNGSDTPVLSTGIVQRSPDPATVAAKPTEQHEVPLPPDFYTLPRIATSPSEPSGINYNTEMMQGWYNVQALYQKAANAQLDSQNSAYMEALAAFDAKYNTASAGTPSNPTPISLTSWNPATESQPASARSARDV